MSYHITKVCLCIYSLIVSNLVERGKNGVSDPLLKLRPETETENLISLGISNGYIVYGCQSCPLLQKAQISSNLFCSFRRFPCIMSSV
jgi:hypothetical protein